MEEGVAVMDAPVGLLEKFSVEIYHFSLVRNETKVVVDGMFLVGEHGDVANLSRVVVGWWNGGLSAAVDGYVLGCRLHEEQYMTVPGGKMCLLCWCYFGQD
jgi:hypothetical protein